MPTPEYALPTSVAQFIPDAAPRDVPPDIGDLDTNDALDHGAGESTSVLGGTIDGVRSALSGDDELPDRVDPASVEAAHRYMQSRFGTPEDVARREHIHRLSIMAAQLGHPMSPGEIEGHEASDRGAAAEQAGARQSPAPQRQRVVGKAAAQKQAAQPAIDPQQAFMAQAAPVATHLVMRYGVDAVSAAVIAAKLMAPNDPRAQVGQQVATALHAVMGLPAQLPGAVAHTAQNMRNNAR